MFSEMDVPAVEQFDARSGSREASNLWLSAWLGTVVAGGVFGVIEGSIFGLILGPPLAALFGAAVFATAAVLTWALWLTPIAPLIAVAAGAATGFVATAVSWDSIFLTDFPSSLQLATFIGGFGAGLSSIFYWLRSRSHRAGTASIAIAAWHFSLRDLFLRFTVAAAIVACWSFAIKGYLIAKEAAALSESLDEWAEENW